MNRRPFVILGGVILVLVIAFLVLDESGTPAAALNQNSTPNYTAQDIQDALQLGKDNKFSLASITAQYTIQYGKESNDSILVLTPFSVLATASSEAEKNYTQLSQKEIDETIGDNTLDITFYGYGDTDDFADSYNAVIKFDGQVIKPSSQELSEDPHTSAFWPKSPSYASHSEFVFDDFHKFQGKQFQFVLIKDDGEEVFNVDMSKLR